MAVASHWVAAVQLWTADVPPQMLPACEQMGVHRCSATPSPSWSAPSSPPFSSPNSTLWALTVVAALAPLIVVPSLTLLFALQQRSHLELADH